MVYRTRRLDIFSNELNKSLRNIVAVRVGFTYLDGYSFWSSLLAVALKHIG